MAANGPYKVSCFKGEDVSVVVTCDDSVPTVSGITLLFRLFDEKTGTVPTGGGPYTAAPNVEVTSAPDKEITCRLATTSMATGTYRWELCRTNSGTYAVLAWGPWTISYRP